jgi:hypothetical protein
VKIIDLLRILSWRRKIHGLPTISVRTTTNDPGSPTLPNPVWETMICDVAGKKVGEATFGLSPRSDDLYIYRLEVSEPVRRKGYGLAFLGVIVRFVQIMAVASRRAACGKALRFGGLRAVSDCASH